VSAGDLEPDEVALLHEAQAAMACSGSRILAPPGGAAAATGAAPGWSWEVFPAPDPEAEARFLGEAEVPVFTLMSGKAFCPAVTEPRPLTAEDQYPGRVRVRYPSGKRYHVRPQRLVRLYGRTAAEFSSEVEGAAGSHAVGEVREAEAPHRPVVLVCGETNHYRQLARVQPRSGDRVLEVGSDFGHTTVNLAKACLTGHVIALDKSASHVQEAQRCHPALDFRCMDLFSDSAELAQLGPFDSIFVDINGNRALGDVLRAISVLRVTFPSPPRLVVIKSRELHMELDQEVRKLKDSKGRGAVVR